MKWLKWSVLILVIVLIALAAYVIGTARRSDQPVGFQVQPVKTASGMMAVAIWYPTTKTPLPTTFVGGQLLSVVRDGPIKGTALPLVVISHGNGGSALSHVDLAMELASAGYVVAAPTHPGDNYADNSRQSSPALFSQRAEQMRSTVDYLLGSWAGAERVNPGRVSAYGMSAGAFTVLSLIGGRPAMDRIATHCIQTPEFICEAMKQVGSPLLGSAEGAGEFKADPRIRQAVIVAPGLGFTYAGNALAGVQAPVQLWFGDQDETVPHASNAAIVVAGLGSRVEVHEVKGATHFSFLAPCGLLQPAQFCQDTSGFDRAEVHRRMNADILRFLDSHTQGAGQ
ncbi:MAG TPA: dienelactone hydrolase family protein [Luteimonas sp.]|nr:dienelactone hydrolase family protein [Luteimonas sp.]